MPNIYIFIAITRKDFTNATLSTTSGSFRRALFFKKSTAQPFFPNESGEEKKGGGSRSPRLYFSPRA